MKYRSDFVTNSSSSSFICVFKNKAEFLSQMSEFGNRYPEYLNIVLSDLENNKKTRAEIFKELKEHFEDEAYYELYLGFKRIPHYGYAESKEIQNYWKKKLEEVGLEPYEIMKLPEYKQKLKEYIDEKMAVIEKELPKRAYLSSVEYGDDSSFFSYLEHDIMPSMPFVYKVISHH